MQTTEILTTMETKEIYLPEVKTEFLFTARIQVQAAMDVGPGPDGHRMIFMHQSGYFEGPKLRGEIISMSGGDWARVRADGSGAIDVRVCLKTHDGAIILMTYGGRMITTPENFAYVMDYLKPDDPKGAEERYYLRTNPLFETGDQRYAWLNHIVAIGKGRTGDGGVIHEVFAVH
ncbi:DUF3237 domain-containing protein [Sphaerospermopsis sp. LEGE 00249]|jgi:hypothetical protein|uniref:DUF3237 domain-containing protein n=1 Tax=Sphaerospermopsis sp. LEGE 00249 TaxID=1380707 RepID=UPI00164D151F|nr:DUF3237 domain-containing protein [Sphaerospermopsis sp. LEGE 00249]MBC5793753.1 DUF3237 domain-containing protein [Sphaerospermopsis sp. LEGE 00249]